MATQWPLLLLLLLSNGVFFPTPAEASIHEYKSDRFVTKGNAFVVHGGSEGIYSSVSDANFNDSDATAAANNGDAYIR